MDHFRQKEKSCYLTKSSAPYVVLQVSLYVHKLGINGSTLCISTVRFFFTCLYRHVHHSTQVFPARELLFMPVRWELFLSKAILAMYELSPHPETFFKTLSCSVRQDMHLPWYVSAMSQFFEGRWNSFSSMEQSKLFSSLQITLPEDSDVYFSCAEPQPRLCPAVLLLFQH